MNIPDSVRIARNKTVADWKAMKGRLARGNDTHVWMEAFKEFFEGRLDSRYFAPIKTLEALDAYDGEGFSIVTLHCSLIEFLAASLEGKIYRPRGNGALDEFEYSNSGDMFARFLREQLPFKEVFHDDMKAKDFYTNVRCALLHEARTRNGWRIRFDRNAKLAIDVDAKIVYRNKMQEAFDGYVKWYGENLPLNAPMQKAFIRKFDSLCSN